MMYPADVVVVFFPDVPGVHTRYPVVDILWSVDVIVQELLEVDSLMRGGFIGTRGDFLIRIRILLPSLFWGFEVRCFRLRCTGVTSQEGDKHGQCQYKVAFAFEVAHMCHCGLLSEASH